jgi:hypothetical protein
LVLCDRDAHTATASEGTPTMTAEGRHPRLEALSIPNRAFARLMEQYMVASPCRMQSMRLKRTFAVTIGKNIVSAARMSVERAGMSCKLSGEKPFWIKKSAPSPEILKK